MPNFYQGDGQMVQYLFVNLVLKQGELGGSKIKGQDLYTRTSTCGMNVFIKFGSDRKSNKKMSSPRYT